MPDSARAASTMTLPGKHRKVYRDWSVVAAAVVGMIFSYSTLLGVTFGLFVIPLSTEFGWSRTEISFAATISSLLIIVLSPLLGVLIDRYGVRRILLPGLFLFGLTVCTMSLLTQSLWHFYLMYILIPLSGFATLPTTYTRVILNWFDEKRGLALGIALSGIGLSGIFAPPFIQYVISSFDWRTAYIVMGGMVLTVGLPIIFFVLKESPGDNELHSKESNKSQQTDNDKFINSGFAFSEAIKQRSFWLMTVAFILTGITTTGTVLHLVPLLTDSGMSSTEAAGMVSLMGVCLIIARVVCGYLIDKFFAPFVAAVFLSGPIIGLIFLALDFQGFYVMLAVCLLGLGFGAEFDLMSYLTSRYIGLRAYGKTYGVMYSAFNIGASIGVVAMGWAFDKFGVYTPGLWCLIACMTVAIGLIMVLGPYTDFSQNQE